MQDKKNVFGHGLSIDETKVSVLIITYIIGFISVVVMCILQKDVDGLKQVVFAIIAAITGVNVTNSIVGGSSTSTSETIFTPIPSSEVSEATETTEASTSTEKNDYGD